MSGWGVGVDHPSLLCRADADPYPPEAKNAKALVTAGMMITPLRDDFPVDRTRSPVLTSW